MQKYDLCHHFKYSDFPVHIHPTACFIWNSQRHLKLNRPQIELLNSGSKLISCPFSPSHSIHIPLDSGDRNFRVQHDSFLSLNTHIQSPTSPDISSPKHILIPSASLHLHFHHSNSRNQYLFPRTLQWYPTLFPFFSLLTLPPIYFSCSRVIF